VVSDSEVLSPQEFEPTVIADGGQYEFNFLLLTADGSVSTYRFAYSLDEYNFLFVTMGDGHKGPGLLESLQRRFDYPLYNSDNTLGTLQGEVVVDGFTVGTFTVNSESTQYRWYSGDGVGFPIDETVRNLTLKVKSPLEYNIKFTVVGYPPDRIRTSYYFPTYATLSERLNLYDYQGVSPFLRFARYGLHAAATLSKRFGIKGISRASQTMAVEKYLEPVQTFDMYVYSTYEEFVGEQDTLPEDVHAVIVFENGRTYLYRRLGDTWSRLYDDSGFSVLFDEEALIWALNTDTLYRYTKQGGLVID